MNAARTNRCLLTLMVVAGLSACGDNDDLQRRIQDVKNSPGDPVEPLPEVEQPETFIYDAHALREPFTGAGDASSPIPIETTESEIAVVPQAVKRQRREFLENFELDSLTMVGTLNWDNRLYGLVSDPDGLIHRVTVDNFMGKNYGQIKSVHDDRIELKEYVSDSRAWLEKDAQLALEEG